MSAVSDRGGERVFSLATPEGTSVTLPLAHPVERLFAYAIDVLLSQLLMIFVLIVLLVVAVTLRTEVVLAIAIVSVFAVRHGYFLFFEIRWHGATPAKRLFRLRVVPRDGSALATTSVVARNVMRDVEIGVPLAIWAAPEQIVGRAPVWLLLPALLWLLVLMALPFLARDRSRAGDLVAGTVVVRVPRARLLADEARAAAGSLVRFHRDQLRHYGEHELETLAQLLRDVDSGRADDETLRVVARTIVTRIAYEGRAHESDPYGFLRAFYRAQRTELERELVLGKRVADKHERGRS